MIYSQICVNFRILGKKGDDWAKREYTKLKRESRNAPVLTKARLNSPKLDTPRGSRSHKLNTAQARLLHKRWAFFRATRTGEPNNAQARSHLAQAN